MKLAIAQMCSSNTHAANVATLEALAAEAHAAGADLLALPEAAGLVNKDFVAASQIVRPEADDPFVAACRALASQYGMWIHTGSTPIRLEGEERFRNRGHLIDPQGKILAHYDKIHLFDVDLPGETPRRESDRYVPGEEAVSVPTPWGVFGLSVCYDIRFPHLYRDYARAGASVLLVPSAFALRTGEDHWETLLRARAIENGAYVIAAAQAGHHDDGRQTWGHSLVIDPWGKVLLDMEKRIGLAVLELDMTAVNRARASIPSLANERPYHIRA
ncbi:carbon-nitrogen hydrolase family protein [Arsenicitalea aurantiaca]|uniref:Carbon-nitrogen hydrolase family protein n=1 Tax=Arsenicitalea aurantiaca TaxID=1783274 RepID=A0A433XMQ6_9HYPH|nr:carbon-nitrogen hydrolase family protein [Arsenicitalea aurantiaca]